MSSGTSPVFSWRNWETLSTHAHVPPIPAKPTTYIISSQSLTIGVLRYCEGKLVFIVAKTSCRPFFSATSTLRFLNVFTWLIPTLNMARCAMRGKMKTAARVRHPRKASASSSVIQTLNSMKMMLLQTVRCSRAVSLRSSSFGAGHDSWIFCGSCCKRSWYDCPLWSSRAVCNAARMEAHSDPKPPQGRKMRAPGGNRSGTHARMHAKAVVLSCCDCTISAVRAYDVAQMPSPCQKYSPPPQASFSHLKRASRLRPCLTRAINVATRYLHHTQAMYNGLPLTTES
mmetsp:Transcript_60198/g.175921  ORF Transcript_60198/g.175921 Transcript_60198/m.175921 type:complete len:285 (-) Transcript_60198:300-1154(-)